MVKSKELSTNIEYNFINNGYEQDESAVGRNIMTLIIAEMIKLGKSKEEVIIHVDNKLFFTIDIAEFNDYNFVNSLFSIKNPDMYEFQFHLFVMKTSQTYRYTINKNIQKNRDDIINDILK